MLIALYDTETNGLLKPQKGKTMATKMHSLGIKFSDGRIVSGADAYVNAFTADVEMPSGKILKDVYHCTNESALLELQTADMRVAHNGQDFDERIIPKFYPWWEPKPGSTLIDTLLVSRLLYPVISKTGPNTHKVPGNMKVRHSVEAWGYRLGEKKDKAFDPGDWQTWSEDMQVYMLQDIESLEKIFKWLMSRKPSEESVEIEHGFASIIRRQECWGFTFDYSKALELAALVQGRIATLEADLIESYGSWWQPSPVTTIKATRKQKLVDFPDITQKQFTPTGRPKKDYIGPPMCYWEEGAKYTPVDYVEFNPGSRQHVQQVLFRDHGWKPKKFTEKGAPQVDDEVLRSLPYPEAQKLADYYAALKVHGYVSAGKKAWISVAHDEGICSQCGGSDWRMHGSMNTIGTYTFRGSHMDPNMGQIPTRDPEYGHKCRELFCARCGFTLVGFDGSGMQLRLLAHYLHRWDGGAYANVFAKGVDPHGFMRDTIGTDLMGEGDAGRGRGKTLNYALTFGGGDRKLGSIIEPHAKDARKLELGAVVKRRMLPVFGTAFDDLKGALRASVETRGYIVGLDGRKAQVSKPHAALATLLQMGEAVVMKKALIIFDNALQAEGLRPGVDRTGTTHPALADYEFCANVHDEAQADVRPEHLAVYSRLAQWAVPEAGRQLGVKCPLKSDVKSGPSWVSTH